MDNYKHTILRVLILTSLLLVLSCDEDYVNSLSTDKPIVYIQTNDNLDALYLGESIEDIELILRVENSPAISQLAFSLNFDHNFLSPEQIEIL